MKLLKRIKHARSRHKQLQHHARSPQSRNLCASSIARNSQTSTRATRRYSRDWKTRRRPAVVASKQVAGQSAARFPAVRRRLSCLDRQPQACPHSSQPPIDDGTMCATVATVDGSGRQPRGPARPQQSVPARLWAVARRHDQFFPRLPPRARLARRRRSPIPRPLGRVRRGPRRNSPAAGAFHSERPGHARDLARSPMIHVNRSASTD